MGNISCLASNLPTQKIPNPMATFSQHDFKNFYMYLKP